MKKIRCRYFQNLLVFRAKTYALLLAACVIITPASFWAEEKAAQPLMLAKTYQSDIDPAEYWVSEKLDGVRARWDGEKLVSRQGNQYHPPAWFTKNFPAEVLDGELWIGRGKFEQTSSVVRKKEPHEGWREVRFMVFDLPTSPLSFGQRLKQMKNMVSKASAPHLAYIEQVRVKDAEELMKMLAEVTEGGGEGLMLHKDSAFYQSGRSDNLLKLKSFEDEEAVVIGYKPGKGKYEGLVGSLKVENSRGVFYIGSGLSDSDRANPPAIGSSITFKYSGLTSSGLPRFPVFLRIRDEEPEQ